MTKRKTKAAPPKPPRRLAIAPVPGATERDEGQTAPIVVTPVGLGAVEAAASVGVGLAGLAALLGIGVTTLKRACERQPELLDAIQRGKSKDEFALVSALREQGLNGYAPALMFLLKTVHLYRENSDASVNVNVQTGVLRVEKPLSMDEWTARLAEHAATRTVSGEEGYTPRALSNNVAVNSLSHDSSNDHEGT